MRTAINISLVKTIFTIGHSNRMLEIFIQFLKASGIERIVDVRTVPRSRHNPQFNRDTLPQALAMADIGYTHIAGLGGLRHPHPDSPNTGWRNTGFRSFADHMQTEEFEESLKELISAAENERIAIMCAEAVPWRCHRSLIADALTIRGIKVEHIISKTSHYPHELTAWAKVKGNKLTYPAIDV